ncbi:MAG: potassium transporter KtrB [Stomatobaculum sp.]|nr:potassium transporter KtrB [Stomatobaculum sp.]
MQLIPEIRTKRFLQKGSCRQTRGSEGKTVFRKKPFSATRILAYGFLVSILCGTFLLMLPAASAPGVETRFIDALFTAASAVCVTGLVTVPTFSQWSFFGQFIILLLVQTGGLCIIAFTILFFLIMGKRTGLKERLLLQAAYNVGSMSGITTMARHIFTGAFVVEGCGALLVMPRFVKDFGPRGVWVSIFHAVSAFCNAGMDIIGPDSLAPYAGDVWINLVTSALIILGGIGFPIWWIILGRLKDRLSMKERPAKAPYPGLYLKTVLLMTGGLLLAGTAAVLLLEYSNPETLGPLSFGKKLLAAFFQSVTLRTAGFYTISQKGLRNSTCMIACILMFIGGSPSGTAGGIKTTTFLIIAFTVLSMLKEKDFTEFLHRKISENTVRRALAIFMASLTAAVVSMTLLTAVCPGDFLDCLYEVVSAVGTVGLSRGLTENLNTAGKAVIIGTMFLGRIGPVSLSMFFNTSRFQNLIVCAEEPLSVG